MKTISLFLFSFLLVSPNLFSQDLLGERIRKVEGRKRSIFLDRGIFHNGKTSGKSSIKAVRHFYSGKKGFERIVIDFETNSVPRIYGHIASHEKKIYMDIFHTELSDKLKSFGVSNFVRDLDFFPISEDSLSLEISLKEKFSADVFYLENPGRFVIDIKK